MKKITNDEFDEIMGHGKGSSGPFYNFLLGLKVDDPRVITKAEWGKNYSPTTVINRVMRRHGMQFEWKALSDRSGWAIRRVK